MKKSLLSAVAIAVFGLLFSGLVLAQDDKLASAAGGMYVISAKAGGVNYAEGKVSIVRKVGKSGLLLKNDKIEIGDKVTTGADGRVEILLNPGSFIRLGANAEFEFETTDLDDLKLKLSAGSAIFEVYADNEFKVSLDLPDADLELTKSGVYRVDVLPDGSGKIFVWKGKVVISNDEAEVKAGKSAIVKGKWAGGIAKFDRDSKDVFDIWSDLRAKEASKINRRLQRDALTDSLLNSYNRGTWNMFGTFGLWVFDSFSTRWSFLPFGSGWRSPYGYDYGFNIFNCPLPQVVYMPPVTTVNPTNSGSGDSQGGKVSEEHLRTLQTPTFQRFENNQRNETRGGSRRNDDATTPGDNNGGWNNTRDRNDDTRPTLTPSQTMPSQPSSSPTTRDSDPITTPVRVNSKSNPRDN